MSRRRAGLLAVLVAALVATSAAAAVTAAALGGSSQRAAPAPSALATTPIRHVFVIVLENEGRATTFGPGSPAPYLSQTLRAGGAYLPNYYGIGHNSNDNYIAMISGQAPNIQTQSDCQFYDDVSPGTIGSYGQAHGTGCLYPTGVPTIASQLTAAGLTWRDYNDGIGADPEREAGVCGHPPLGARDNTQTATASDQYATRHNPFVYFHSIIDDTSLCDSHVVGLDALSHDLASPASTPNYVFVTPSLCNDGHDAKCANGGPGGLGQADAFLRQWVPKITSAPAFKQQNGLLIVTFDEATSSDTSSCCGEVAGPGSPLPGITGSGGGGTGAVLLSPCIAPGTVSQQPYNHYTMMRSVEDIFSLPHLGYAGLPGERSFGADVFTRACNATLQARVNAPPLASTAGTRSRIGVSWGATRAFAQAYAVQVRTLGARAGRWRTLRAATTQRSLTFAGIPGATYQFRVRATGVAGSGAWRSATTVLPSGVRPAGGSYRGNWRVHSARGAWLGHAIRGTAGSSFSLGYRGGSLALIGERDRGAGRMRVVLDGHARTVVLSGGGHRSRAVLFRSPARGGAHRLTITVSSGVVALEGVAITARG